MDSKIGYTNLQVMALTSLTLGVSVLFGFNALQIIMAYISASIGLFVLYALDVDDQNKEIWPYNELMRWFGVLVLMVIHAKKAGQL
jgi:hypothetical protein